MTWQTPMQRVRRSDMQLGHDPAFGDTYVNDFRPKTGIKRDYAPLDVSAIESDGMGQEYANERLSFLASRNNTYIDNPY